MGGAEGDLRRDGWSGVRNEAKSGTGRLGRTGSGGRGGGSGGGGGLRNEPNCVVFRFGRISYGGTHAGLVLPAESLAALQFRKVGEVGPFGIDDMTM